MTPKQKAQRGNHPKKGSTIKVEPITDLDAIEKIRHLLKDKPRDLAIFDIGINTNLRAIDLTQIRVGQVRGLHVGDDMVLRESKTGKERRITINERVYMAIRNVLATLPHDTPDTALLFQSQKTMGQKPLTTSYINLLVKRWCKAIGLRGNYGAHTLRKTFGFIHRKVHCTPLVDLMAMFNHNTQKQTLVYLCIQPEEIRNHYLKVI
jgi:integrase